MDEWLLRQLREIDSAAREQLVPGDLLIPFDAASYLVQADE